MDNLLLCPFCGGEADIEEIPGSPFTNEPYTWAVGCKACNIGWYEETQAEATSKWNRRAQPSEKPLTLDELRQMDGEPVWVQELPPYTTAGYKVLAAPAVNEYGDICFDGGDCYAPYDYGNTWLAYRTKPERSEGK